MNVKVAGIWEIGWNTPIKEIDLWEMVMREFDIKDHYMSPITGIDHPVKERKNIQQVLKENPGYTAIFCDERAETTLEDFKHPKKALYVFGRTNFSPFLSFKRPKDLSIKIQTALPKSGLFWSHQAAAIILHDRLLKQKKKK